MKPSSLATALLLTLTFGVRLPAAEAGDPSPEEVRRGHRARTFLAKPRTHTGPAALVEVERAEAAERVQLVRAHPRLDGLRTLQTDGASDVLDVIKRLRRTGAYDYVEPDYIRTSQASPNDPRFTADQWSLQNTGQAGGTAGADINATAAWDLQREAPDVIVAVIDSGVLVSHEDIAANIWVNPAERSGIGSNDDDHNGYIDDLHGIDATAERTSSRAGDPNDTEGHGTHVAGIIGAVGDNNVGVSGVAWKTQIMPLKFLGRFGGSVSASIACIDYAIAKGAHIINGSYGSASYSKAEYDALARARDAGIIFVASAGNDSQEISELPLYPAAYALDNIVAVASTTRQDKLANYSTYGSGLVELAAPGSSILSLGVTAATPYATQSGTSMAAPHVTGALALLKQKYPEDNYRALINRVLNSVDVVPALENRVHTNGRLNLLRALTATDTRPFNDDFARRAVIKGDVNLVRGSIRFATLQPGEPVHGNASATTASLWWTWTAPAGAGQLAIDTAGSGFDTVVALYTGNSLEALRLVASNDDTAPDVTTSRLVTAIVPGTTYIMTVAGKPATAASPGQDVLSLSLVTIPNNDSFAAAQPLSGPSVTVTANNAGATAEIGEPKPKTPLGSPIGEGKSVWFKWTAPVTRRYHLSVTDAVIDPVVSIYTGNAVATLTEVTSNDDSDLDYFRYDSLASFNAIAGVTYQICVDAANGSGGRFNLSINDAEWQALTFTPVYASPAIGADGTIYALDNIALLAAFRPDGFDKWAWLPEGFFDIADGGAIAVDSDGTLYFGTYSGDFYAVDVRGKGKWRYTTGGEIWAAPALAADGTIYVKSSDDQLYALNPDGTLKWKFTIPGDTYSAPVVGADGTIYIASGGDAALYALTPDGTQKWRANLDATVYASPAIGADGTLYLGNYDGRFFAIRPDGTERWRFDTHSPLSGSAAIDARGVVYFGSYDKKLYALDAATGAKRWDYATGDIIRATCPVIADDGTIYIGSDDGFIHALNPDGTLRRTYATGGAILAAPILAAGRLYVASSDAKLHAFEIGANLARSPWPMHRHNLRRTGRVIAPLPGMPVISTQPVAATAEVGTPATFSITASVPEGGALTYQWRVNNLAIPGATAATLTLPLAQASDVGTYSVVAIGPGGSTLSQSATLTVNGATNTDSRLINLAVRTNAGPGDDGVLFVGLVVGGANTTGPKPLLLRAVGPTLAGFGVEGALGDPKLELFAAGGTASIAANDNWNGDTALSALAPQLGAFAFASNDSKDAALISTRPGGGYTVQISSATTASGTTLAEIYDATPSNAFSLTTPRLINVSARTHVGAGGDILIAGFAIGGTGSKQVLVRAIGPTLTVFGVGDVLANPKLELFAGGSTTALSSNDDWGAAANNAQVAAAATSVGAFPLALESRDAVLLVTLPPGSYTAQISGVNNTTGTALVEVYEVP